MSCTNAGMDNRLPGLLVNKRGHPTPTIRSLNNSSNSNSSSSLRASSPSSLSNANPLERRGIYPVQGRLFRSWLELALSGAPRCDLRVYTCPQRQDLFRVFSCLPSPFSSPRFDDDEIYDTGLSKPLIHSLLFLLLMLCAVEDLFDVISSDF